MKSNKTNIIAISGKLGSGKDTVGQIIQYLTGPYSQMEDGPSWDECIEFGGDLVYCNVETNWQIKKMAGKLKEIASIILGVPVEKFEDRGFKESYLSEEWNYVDKHGFKKQMTVREFLQKIGTDAMREGLHENVWANAFWADYQTKEIGKFLKGKHKGNVLYAYPNWIITDLRFENELQSVVERRGITIRVNRDFLVDFHGDYVNNTYKNSTHKVGENIKGTTKYKMIPLNEHPSETALDHITTWDYVIENNSTISDLIEKVREILIKENII